jgi:hypothetical protein
MSLSNTVTPQQIAVTNAEQSLPSMPLGKFYQRTLIALQAFTGADIGTGKKVQGKVQQLISTQFQARNFHTLLHGTITPTPQAMRLTLSDLLAALDGIWIFSATEDDKKHPCVDCYEIRAWVDNALRKTPKISPEHLLAEMYDIATLESEPDERYYPRDAHLFMSQAQEDAREQAEHATLKARHLDIDTFCASLHRDIKDVNYYGQLTASLSVALPEKIFYPREQKDAHGQQRSPLSFILDCHDDRAEHTYVAETDIGEVNAPLIIRHTVGRFLDSKTAMARLDAITQGHTPRAWTLICSGGSETHRAPK